MTDILSTVTEILRELFDNPEMVVTAATSADTVEHWDSLKQTKILMAVEEAFAIRFKSREIDKMKNVGDLVSAIDNKIEQ